jgi:hypothetical protein
MSTIRNITNKTLWLNKNTMNTMNIILQNRPKEWYNSHTILHTIFETNTILQNCFIPKKYFDRTNIICKNKICEEEKGIEIDYVKISENGTIDLIDFTNNVDFTIEENKEKIDNMLDIKKLLILNNLRVGNLYMVGDTIKTIKTIKTIT